MPDASDPYWNAMFNKYNAAIVTLMGVVVAALLASNVFDLGPGQTVSIVAGLCLATVFIQWYTKRRRESAGGPQ